MFNQKDFQERKSEDPDVFVKKPKNNYLMKLSSGDHEPISNKSGLSMKSRGSMLMKFEKEDNEIEEVG